MTASQYSEKDFEEHIETHLLASGYQQRTALISAAVTGKIDVRGEGASTNEAVHEWGHEFTNGRLPYSFIREEFVDGVLPDQPNTMETTYRS
jgi:hypothetical protein